MIWQQPLSRVKHQLRGSGKRQLSTCCTAICHVKQTRHQYCGYILFSCMTVLMTKLLHLYNKCALKKKKRGRPPPNVKGAQGLPCFQRSASVTTTGVTWTPPSAPLRSCPVTDGRGGHTGDGHHLLPRLGSASGHRSYYSHTIDFNTGSDHTRPA